MNNFIYHSPANKTINISNNTKRIYEIKDVALMCPHCLHMIETNIVHISSITNVLVETEYLYAKCNYYGMCPNCKEDVKFEIIDINMAQIINILNSKGYYTAFCCEGHIESDDDGKDVFVKPYIYFYLWNDSKVLINNPLPDSWGIDDDDKKAEIFSIRDNINNEMPKSIINGNEIIDEVAYIGWLKRHWDQKKRLEDIYNWAINLPDKDNDIKDAEYQFIKINGEIILINNSEKYINAIKE